MHSADVREELADLDAALAVLRNLNGEAMTPPLRLPLGVDQRWRAAPCRRTCSRAGLGSKVSTCDGPPFMNRKMTRLARAREVRAACGASGSGRGALAFGRRQPARRGPAARRRRRRRPARAPRSRRRSCRTPRAGSWTRRSVDSSRTPGRFHRRRSSIDEHELVACRAGPGRSAPSGSGRPARVVGVGGREERQAEPHLALASAARPKSSR